RVVVAPHLAEELVDATARAAGEEVGQAHGAGRVGVARLGHPVGAGHGRGEREELHRDVDGAEEEGLLPLEPRLVDHHAVEDGAGEPAARAVGEAHVAGELAERRVTRPGTCRMSSSRCQARTVFHSLAAAASRRMSESGRSAKWATRKAIDSMAKALVARSATLTATASCLPIGTPHCTRALPHLRQSSRPTLAIPAV